MLLHPTWVRGLKHTEQRIEPKFGRLHPTWVRGLKLQSVIPMI